MQVWLVTIGEPVPVGVAAKDRLHRTGYFAHFLADHGHDVIWWTSTFNHFRKEQLFENDHTLTVNDHLQIRLLHGCGYRSNVSLARIRDHQQIGKKFAAMIKAETRRPDIIVAGFPTIELCQESVRYGIERAIPVLLDIRDLWPDIFLELLPGVLRPAGRLVLAPLFRKSHAACRDATAITGITGPYVDWGLRRGGRQRTAKDRSFAFGYLRTEPTPDKLRAAEAFWDSRGVTSAPGQLTIAFCGAISWQFEFAPIVEAARILRQSGKNFRFVFCGVGDRLEQSKAAAAGFDNMIFTGWVEAAEIRVLLRRSSIGLIPYRESPNYTMNIPNKPVEYLSEGLPLALSLKSGVMYDLIQEHRCGFSYGGDARELAATLSRLHGDPAELKSLSRNAAALFEAEFVAEKVYGDMMVYLENIVAGEPQ